MPHWDGNRHLCLVLYCKPKQNFGHPYYVAGWDCTGSKPRFRIDTLEHIRFYRNNLLWLFAAHLRLWCEICYFGTGEKYV